MGHYLRRLQMSANSKIIIFKLNHQSINKRSPIYVNPEVPFFGPHHIQPGTFAQIPELIYTVLP